MTSLSHSFNTELACQLGDPCLAILVNHFQYWINYNKRLKRNFQEGHTWMYQTRIEIAAHFPYWSTSQVRRMTDRLVELGILIKGNFNKQGFDKTVWYAFKNEEMFTIGKFAKCLEESIDESATPIDEIVNGSDEIVTPIPNTIPNTKPDISLTTTTSLEKSQPESRIGGGGGGLKNFISSIIYKNTKGETCEIRTEDIFRHFIRLPYETSVVEQAINEANASESMISNILKYIESICFRIVKTPITEIRESKYNSKPKTIQPEISKEQEEIDKKNFEEAKQRALNPQSKSKEEWRKAIQGQPRYA